MQFQPGKIFVVLLGFLAFFVPVALAQEDEVANQAFDEDFAIKFNLVNATSREVEGNLTFNFPSQCTEFLEMPEETSQKISHTPGINNFLYATAYCEAYFLSLTSSNQVEYDYISILDLDNLPIEMLPFTNCDIGIGTTRQFAWCESIAKLWPDINEAEFQIVQEFLPGFTTPSKKELVNLLQPLQIDPSSCRLVNKSLSMKAVLKAATIYCEELTIDQPMYSGFYLHTVSYLDVNADGYMDMVAMITEFHHGTFHPTTWAAFTRTNENQERLTRLPFSEIVDK